MTPPGMGSPLGRCSMFLSLVPMSFVLHPPSAPHSRHNSPYHKEDPRNADRSGPHPILLGKLQSYITTCKFDGLDESMLVEAVEDVNVTMAIWVSVCCSGRERCARSVE